VLRGLQAAEPAADDDHPVPLTLRAIARAHDVDLAYRGPNVAVSDR
jgi:hypothetical protein